MNYISKKDGQRVQGIKVFFSYDLEANGGEGRGVCDCYLNMKASEAAIAAGLEVGAALRPVYNRFGRCEGVMRDSAF